VPASPARCAAARVPVSAVAAEDQFAEILVFGEQQSAFALRHVGDLVVIGTGRIFNDENDVMVVLAQPLDQARVNALIAKPAHAGCAQS
jgi:hypothetical protein